MISGPVSTHRRVEGWQGGESEKYLHARCFFYERQPPDNRISLSVIGCTVRVMGTT